MPRSWKVPGYRMELDMLEITKFLVEKMWTKTEMADAMGVHRDVVFRILRREKEPTPTFVRGLKKIGLDPNKVIRLVPVDEHGNVLPEAKPKPLGEVSSGSEDSISVVRRRKGRSVEDDR